MLYVHGGGDDSGEGGAGRAEGVGMVGAAAGRRDVLPKDRQRGGQAGMGQGGRRDGGRADEGGPAVGGRVDWCGDGVGRRGRVADWWPPLCRCLAEAPACKGPDAAPRKKEERGERSLCLACGEGGDVCIRVGADAPRPFVRPLGRM
jgi:hypothetical protein